MAPTVTAVTEAAAAACFTAMHLRLHSWHWLGFFSAPSLSFPFMASICRNGGHGPSPSTHLGSQQPGCRVCGEARTDGCESVDWGGGYCFLGSRVKQHDGSMCMFCCGMLVGRWLDLSLSRASWGIPFGGEAAM